MKLLTLLLLVFTAVCAGQESGGTEASSGSGGSGSGVSSPVTKVGDSAMTVYIPTNSVLHQFLNATGMEPDSLVAVSSSYSVFLQTTGSHHDS